MFEDDSFEKHAIMNAGALGQVRAHQMLLDLEFDQLYEALKDDE